MKSKQEIRNQLIDNHSWLSKLLIGLMKKHILIVK